ncbi:hypothetical protein [Aquariibacter albus]|uniref:Uncharacterized protein n=1 Tax=Aquariibacter albus TaxID=2759899 RepID=A0A839HH55_9BURK|nr:hypothetical protein [Aquariibacter albus]MBB1161465.1 hypothetical protein [Aquariibacter albus]
MPRWALYVLTDAMGTETHAVLEQLADGSVWCHPDTGKPVEVPVPGSNRVLDADLPRPAWGRDDPAPVPLPVPPSISPAQAREAMFRAGLSAQVDAFIEALPEPQRSVARIRWEYATAIERADPLVLAAIEAGVMSAAQADDLFRLGAAL